MVLVPDDVWDVTHAELLLKYVIMDSTLEYNPSFSFAVVRNVYLEQLENMFKNLNYTYCQLNQTFWELQQNYTSVEGSLTELGNTRMAMIILAITTVFFAVTTFYVVMRKPKQYW